MSKKPIKIPELCDKHMSLLVHGAGYKPHETWRALVAVANVALFQAATVFKRTHELIGDDITQIGKIGCLACYRPDKFGELVEVAKSKDLGEIKALGEKWIIDVGYKLSSDKAEE